MLGAKVVDRIAKDLKDAFPDMSGFSPRNIKYMRKFAECWPDFEFVQQVVAQIPWRTNIKLMDKLNTQEERIWYARQTIKNGWSSNVLDFQIQSKLLERTGKSVNNFPIALPPADSDMANQIFKDPYLFDFLGTDMPRREVEIERHPDDKPTIGLLLVKGKNQTVVEYSLAGYQNPIGVAEWKNQMQKALPEELRSSLPSIEEIEKELK